jgi:NAD(P)-dependent dehydrogenase (short-subunit alcohol dehydrogenase family)
MIKNLLITGGSRGIGRACAEIFLTAGWRVTVVARGEADLFALVTAFPNRPLTAIVADVATEAGRARLPDTLFDVVILNAAVFRPGPLLTGEDTFAELWPTNVMANHFLARTLVQRMLKNKLAGHLITLGSLGTDNRPDHLTAYVATKYALRGLFLAWQSELAGTTIKCTLIAPDATLTSSWDGETPPPGILAAETVAELIFSTVFNGTEGRVTIR